MNCPTCTSLAKRFGKDCKRNQRYRCKSCKRTFTESHEKPLSEMRLPMAKVLLCLKLLVEGNSIRSTSRIADVEKKTVLSLLKLAGRKCEQVMDEKVRDVAVETVEVDEIWTFVRKKEGHKTEDEQNDPFIGDAYTFVAIEANTKLVLCYVLGRRDSETALEFIKKLSKITKGRFQLTSDGFKPYIDAVEKVFGVDIDFAQTIKSFSESVSEPVKTVIMGNPDPDKISTSYVERQNLTIRMSMRRLTRRTNGFSKKWENLNYALALHFSYYNFCRPHESLRVTPAMESGITDHIWELWELLMI